MNYAHPLDHPNLVVVHFSPYAGGKFWINCLAHHSAVMPLLGKVHDRHWAMFNIDNDLKQRLKLESINRTLPPADELHNWCTYESGHIDMWGDSIKKLLQPDNLHRLSTNAVSLLDNNQCCIINHETNLDTFRKIKKTLPMVKHIILENTFNFQELASRLKNSYFKVSDNNELTLVKDAFHVDVDNTWFDTNITDHRVRQCLTWLGLESEPMPELQLYIERYFKLHQ